MSQPQSLSQQANQALKRRDWDAVSALCEQGQAEEPEALWPQHCRALAQFYSGHRNEALERLRALLRKERKSHSLWGSLGTLLAEVGDLPNAEKALRSAALYSPETSAAGYYNLANLLKTKGSVAEAIQAYEEALRRDPEHMSSLHNLSTLLLAQGHHRRALEISERMRALNPQRAESWFLAGNILAKCARLSEALRCLDQAIFLNKNSAEYFNNRGNILSSMSLAEEATASYFQATALAPTNPRYASNAIFSLSYGDGITPERLYQAHKTWDEQFGIHPTPPRPQRTPKAASEPLRLGLVSADFGRHPVGWFTLPLLEGHDPKDLQIILYSDRLNEDDVTVRLMHCAYRTHRVRDWSDEQLFDQVVADQVDVLIDVSGHTSHNRLAVFARRPAPVQATWAAYVGTTGLATIDLLIADTMQIPLGDEHLYSETVLRLPVDYVPYAPNPDAPEVAPLPDPKAGIVLGSFNNPVKLSDSCLRLWAQCLDAVGNARILLKFLGLEDPAAAERIRKRFTSQGGDASRLDIEGGAPQAELLANYGRIHIALDSSPYSGGLTTLEALWMGVPVVTLPGRTFASRHSLTHLTHAGLGELCATNADEFVAIVRDLAQDHARLYAYRQGIRARLRDGTTCDGKLYARHLSRALREAWNTL